MLDPKEEAKFAALKDKCRELKVPAPPEVMIGLQVHENGVLTFDDVQRGHSWTRNYWNWMFGMGSCPAVGAGAGSFGAGYMSGKTTGGTIHYNSFMYKYTTDWWGEISDSTRGILVGTSDTAFSLDHYTLQAIITDGTGAGKFSHQSAIVNAPTYDGGPQTWSIVTSRIYNNNSGGSITVKEVGIYGAGSMFNGNNGANYMMERSVLSPAVAVANGAQLTVTYEISMDFSAID